MNHSSTSPRSFSTDQLHAALGDVGGPARPDYLPDIVAQAGRIRQRPAWTFLARWLPMDIAVRRQGVPRAAVLFAVLSLLVALLVAGVAYIGSLRTQPERPLGLPTAPDAWERVLIETPSGIGSVRSLAASRAGLLAVIGEAGQPPNETRLAVSAEGRNWTLVPGGQHPWLNSPSGFGPPWHLSVVGTERGFLLQQFNEVWFSENGYDWRRIADETTDSDLSAGDPSAVTAGGPGLVGVGDGSATYSVDGSEWSLAQVPPLPAQILDRRESERGVGMTGVTAAGIDLVAWGSAEVPTDNGDDHLVVPLLWASHDGRTWADVVDPKMDSVTAVTGGPHGFVAAGQAGSEAAVWIAADGEAWERVARDTITSQLKSAAATSAGYVVVGGLCPDGRCRGQELEIWTSADGRSWSLVPSADVFDGGWGGTTIAWGSRFVVGGVADGKAAIWISGSEESGGSASAGTAPASAIPTAPPARPIDFTGTWEATDVPADSSHLTMEELRATRSDRARGLLHRPRPRPVHTPPRGV